jgi:Peptidase M15
MPIIPAYDLDAPLPGGLTWRSFLDDPEAPISDEAVYHMGRVSMALELLQDDLGLAPLQIVSAYRSIAVNARRGGSRRSLHLVGRACDIAIPSVNLPELVIKARKRFNGVIIFPTYVHLDLRPNRGKINPSLA